MPNADVVFQSVKYILQSAVHLLPGNIPFYWHYSCYHKNSSGAGIGEGEASVYGGLVFTLWCTKLKQ